MPFPLAPVAPQPRPRLLGVVLAVGIAFVAACGGGRATPLSSGPPPSTGLGSAPATAAGSPAASSGAGSSAGQAVPQIDTGLLDLLPSKLDGLDRQNDAEADHSIQTDPSLGQISSAYTTAFYANPNTGDTAFAIVSRLRGGSISDAALRDWRDTYGKGTCSNAGGVVGQAETTIGTRSVAVTRCVEAQQVYYVLMPDQGVLLTITSAGSNQLGRRLVELLPA